RGANVSECFRTATVLDTTFAENPENRCSVVLLLDTSGSMAGAPTLSTCLGVAGTCFAEGATRGFFGFAGSFCCPALGKRREAVEESMVGAEGLRLAAAPVVYN